MNTKKVKLVKIKTNVCPCCGALPKFTSVDERTVLRCPHNHLEVDMYGKNLSSMNRVILTREWNRDTFLSELSEDVLKKLHLNEGSYAVFDMRDSGFMQGFQDVKEAISFMARVYEEDHTCKTRAYRVSDCRFSFLFDSDFLSLAQGDWEGYDDPDNLNYYLIEDCDEAEEPN